MNPINLSLRFLLELVGWFAPVLWIRHSQSGTMQIVLMILVPLLLMTIWGVFAVSNDPSRSGKTVVETPGLLRFALELAVFFIGALSLYKAHYPALAYVVFILIIVHHLFAYKRVKWLLSK